VFNGGTALLTWGGFGAQQGMTSLPDGQAPPTSTLNVTTGKVQVYTACADEAADIDCASLQVVCQKGTPGQPGSQSIHIVIGSGGPDVQYVQVTGTTDFATGAPQTSCGPDTYSMTNLKKL
jgi:hypothetical protein